MSRLSNVLRGLAGGRVAFKCPGCERPHPINVGDSPGPRWTYNGNPDKPTFSPSVLVTWNEPSDNPSEGGDSSKDVPKVCHSFVTDGRIQFLGDCTHALAGQTVDLPEFPHASWEPTP